MELSNCNAVITGGASGLGGATADIIINNGGRVTIIDIQNDLGIKKAEELGSNCNYINIDITDEDLVAENFSEIVKNTGSINLAVNCAGIGSPSKVLNKEGTCPLNLFTKIINVNLIGTFNTLKAAANVMQHNETKNNESKIYEIGGPKIISFGDMVKSILSTINKKRFVVEMPMPLAKIQSTITDLLPLPPILTRDQCEILSEVDNVVSNNHLTLKDLGIDPKDVEEEMKKWLWRYKDGGQFAKA